MKGWEGYDGWGSHGPDEEAMQANYEADRAEAYADEVRRQDDLAAEADAVQSAGAALDRAMARGVVQADGEHEPW